MSWTTDPIIKSMANTFNDKLNNDSTFFQELISSINAAGPLYFSTDGTIWSTNSSNAYGQWMYNTPKLFLSSGSTLLCSWSVCWYDRHNPGNQDGGMLADVWSAAQTKLSPDIEKTGTKSTTIDVGSRHTGARDTSVIELKGGASLKNSEDFKNLKASKSAHINIVVSILTNASYTGGGNQTIINEAVNDVNNSNMSDDNKEVLRNLIRESVNLAKTGVDIFEKVLSTKEVREVLGISTFATYIPPDIAIWGVRRPQDGLLELKSYDKITPKLLDTGISFTGVVCAGTRIFYVAKKPGKIAQWNAVVKDLVTNELWFVGEKDKPYTYPFISTDGSTVALSLFDFEKKI